MTGDNNTDKDSNSSDIDKGRTTKPPSSADQKQLAAAKPDKQMPRQKKPAVNSVNNRSFAVTWFFTVIFFTLVIAFAAYFGHQYWRFQQQRLAALEAQATAQHSELDRLSVLQSRADDRSSRLQQLQNDQQQIQQRLDSYSNRLRALAGTSRDDWLLAEARYLLRLASQRLLIERGTGGAQALLESADRVLQSVEDPDIQRVRNAIANDIVRLKLARNVDRQGIYARLSALQNQLQDLPSNPLRLDVSNGSGLTERPLVVEGDPPPGKVQPTVWYQTIWHSVKRVFAGLLGTVKIEHHDRPPVLLLSREEQTQLLKNLLLMLEQAKFALLHEEPEIYHSSLQQALDWWRDHYSHYSEYEIIKDDLRQLHQTGIVQELPSIAGSVQVLTDYIERFHQLNRAEPAIQDSQIIAPQSSNGEQAQ